jgi:hypothetical protein
MENFIKKPRQDGNRRSPEFGSTDNVQEKNMIQKFLDLSTAHLPQKEFEQLSEFDDESALTVIGHKHGLIIWLPDKDTWDEIRQNFEQTYGWNPDNLDKIIQHAYAGDCWLINFDRDASQIDELEYYDW